VYEWALLRSTLHILDNKSFQCGECKEHPQHEAMKKLKHCETIAENPVHFIGDKREIRFRTCIGNFFTRTVRSLIELQNLYEIGVMPHDGPPVDQPSKMMEVFNVIANHKSDKLEKERKKEKLKNQSVIRNKRLGR
jgi:hypothetical protein